ncbi:MAG: phenylalanine--tRNA ligase subunit beta [Candidatus Diapherotrites archaeon]|uniref:phenylalanine--tRNA ligase n=1 Tax=Candidatus Iainarchaeum sp. TaxID=3101447 RepID=A0A8T4C6B1_9ARCH|nr:phenylalanine--tRNA ligase subunit beta [Candidatus Diapherotrites archaeon]
MVNVDTSLEKLNHYLTKPITIEKLEQTLFQMGHELDEKNPDALKIDITADRPDMVSTAGVARVLNAYLGHVKGFPLVERKKSAYVLNVDASVAGVRPYTAALVVKNISLNQEKLDELIWVQEKIHATFARERKKAAIGIYPLKKIHWPITFQAQSPEKISFQPLGLEKMLTGRDILREHPTGKKYAHLLEEMPVFPVFRDSMGTVLSMPPIINSHNVGQVTLHDRDLFVEVSGHYWPAVSVILDILAYLFSDMNGEIYQVNVQYPTENFPRTTPELGKITQTIELDALNALLGTTLTSAQTMELLERMLYRVVKSNAKQLVVECPSFRVDVLHPHDVMDDVARAYGFDNLSPLPVNVSTRGGVLRQTRLNEDVRTCVTGLGFHEVISWALTSHEYHFTSFERAETPHVKLGLAKEQGLTMVRNMLYPETIRALLSNRSQKAPFKLFELDQIVDIHSNTDTGTRTHDKLCLVLAHASATFDEMKGYVDAISSFLGEKPTYTPAVLSGFIDGRAANVNVGKFHGFLGEMHPRVLSMIGIPFPCVVFEIYLSH